jgi:L-lactate dehydrogenase (cytochrome)
MSIYKTLRSVLRFRGIERNAAKRRLARAASIEDLRRIAKRRTPGGVFDYIDGAAEDEITAGRNRDGFTRLEFRPRILRDVSDIDTTTKLMGELLPMPLVLAPTGFTRMAHPEGELAVARAANRAGLPYTLSSLSTRSIEEVRAVSDGDLWFQVYVWRDKGLLAEMLQRAQDAHYSTIMITVDTAVLGRRERDVRRGFEMPPQIGLDTLVDGALHPGWTWAFVRSDPIVFANVAGKSVGDGTDAVTLSEYINSQFDPALSWADIAWFREHWNGRIVLKGVQSVEDAELAAEHEIDAVALSNHGGRQLDGAPPTIELVAPVVDSVGDRIEVICDGGIRRGSDVLKAVALGADACMVGRAYLYALAAAGEPGVDFALELLDGGLRRSMALTGCRSVGEASRELVRWR